MPPHEFTQTRSENRAEPADKLGLGGAAKLREPFMSPQKRFLYQVRGIRLASERPVELHADQCLEILTVPLKQFALRLDAPGSGSQQQGVGLFFGQVMHLSLLLG
jgi:hypothetical protein